MFSANPLHRSIIIIGFLGLVFTAALAIVCFIFAARQDQILEFNQLARGINPFRIAAYRYAALAILFITFVLIHRPRIKSSLQVVNALILFGGMVYCTILIMVDSAFLPEIGSGYWFLDVLVARSGVTLLILSIILMLSSSRLFWYKYKRNGFS